MYQNLMSRIRYHRNTSTRTCVVSLLPLISVLSHVTPQFNFSLKQRGDLGLPLFPGRDLHYKFLTKVLPVYIMRSRSFATSLRRPPFIVNYSGLLYRTYPEPYQCILNIGDGKNKMVKAVDDRPTNMGFRNYLTDALRLPGVPQDELKSPGNLVWWEKDLEKETSSQWRS
jgi:hypothetical protein